MADKTMRVNVTIGEDDVALLVKLIAAMPVEKNSAGLPMAIDAADAFRYALRQAAGRVRR
jgi:hypothetical protein